MHDKRISFEVAVILICLSSCFVLSVSETTILVPSDLTTRSRGDIRKAKGNLQRPVSVIGSKFVHTWREGVPSLRQTLDDDKSDICVRSDASFHALDMILC
jgi:hypothetical protein